MPPPDDTQLRSPAVGARLRDARRARQLTQQQVADAVDVARTTLVAIESGERRVRPDELVRLAQLYERPVSELLRPPRADDGLVVAFRASPLATSPDMQAAVSDLQQLVEDYLALEDVLQAPLLTHYPATRSIEGLDPAAAGDELAATERNRLGLGGASIQDLRELLESEVGLRIFAPPLPSHVAGVYAYAEGVGGCIAVNGHHPPERQLWTIAHDYAHFLTERDRPEATLVRGYERRPRSEQLADAFAEHFLMPSAGLTRRANDLRRSRGRLTPADLLRLADVYGVSFQALVLRLEALKLVPLGTLDKLLERGFKPTDGRRLLDLSADRPRLELLPRRYQYLAVEAYARAAISEGQFARFVRLDRVAARRMAEDLMARPLLVDDGGVAVTEVGWLVAEETI